MRGEPKNIRAGYYLNGEPLPESDCLSTFFVAPFGVAVMLDDEKQNFLNKIYELVINKNQGYYEDSVTLLSLLVISGNFWTY